ncbi:MAG: hypothetical protein AB7F88_07040 [Pyrinomonadaceae bacterium]
MIPYTQPDLSPYERPLTDAELKEFAKPFSEYESRSFSLPFVNLIEVTGISKRLLRSSIEIDAKLLKLVPALGYYASVRVFQVIK